MSEQTTVCVYKVFQRDKNQLIDNMVFLDKTLKAIQEVCDSIIEGFFSVTGLRTKHFERFYLSFNIQYNLLRSLVQAFTLISVSICFDYKALFF